MTDFNMMWMNRGSILCPYTIYHPLQTNPMIVNQNDTRVEEINQRLIPFQGSSQGILTPVLKMRPVTTRRDFFPCVERRRLVQEPIQNDSRPFKISSGFCAGNDSAPRSGYCVDVESILQPRKPATTDDRDAYIPHSRSDLYKNPQVRGRQENQTHLLGDNWDKSTTIPDFVQQRQIGGMFFNNDTRTQMRNLV